MLLCLAFSPDTSCPLFQKCGTKNRVRYIYINKLRHGLGDGVCNALIGMHAFTGCDTVSAVAGHGKPGALKLIRSEHCQEMFGELGQSWEPSVDIFKKLQSFTCKLYTHPQQQCTSTQPVTIVAAQGVGSSSLPSFHHARTASSCIPCALTTRLASGLQSASTSASPIPSQAWPGQKWRWPAHRGMDAGISSSRCSATTVLCKCAVYTSFRNVSARATA